MVDTSLNIKTKVSELYDALAASLQNRVKSIEKVASIMPLVINSLETTMINTEVFKFNEFNRLIWVL